MSSSDLKIKASGSDVGQRLNFRSLFLIYSTTVLMVSVVYFVVSSVAISPHAVAVPPDPHAGPGLQGVETIQTSSISDVSQPLTGKTIPVSGRVDEISNPTSRTSGG